MLVYNALALAKRPSKREAAAVGRLSQGVTSYVVVYIRRRPQTLLVIRRQDKRAFAVRCFSAAGGRFLRMGNAIALEGRSRNYLTRP